MNNTVWQRKFAFLPHQCQNTGKYIWLKWAYMVEIYASDWESGHTWTEQCFWCTEEQFVIMILKGLT
jgi:hypothetical protein